MSQKDLGTLNASGQKNAIVGLFSRIDYRSRGFRRAVVDAIFEKFKKEGTHYNILVGGLVSRELAKEMKGYVKDCVLRDRALKKHRESNGDSDDAISPAEKGTIRKNEFELEFLTKVAKELARIIPIATILDPNNPKKEKIVDLFIVTSPAFDGEIGEAVAHLLAEQRSDIRIWNTGGDRFPVYYVNKLIWALTPTKGIWMRSDYYSTPAERIIKDKIKQTTQSMPDVFVIGCLASSINKPKGELPYAYVTVPAGHRLEDTRVSENQVGCSILEFPENGGQYLYRVHNFKDLVSNELSYIVAPPRTSPVQKRIIEFMKQRGMATRGMLKLHLADIKTKELETAMQKLTELKTFRKIGENFPGVIFYEQSKKFYFDLDWIQRLLKYGRPSGAYHEDRIVSFCCLHAGSIETDYEFFVNETPKIILARKATVLVNAGDTKEGLEHDLDKKGEIVAGMNNNTKQEKVAAHLIGEVIIRVFKHRFAEALAGIGKEKMMIEEKIREYVSVSLLAYYYRLGNHDTWECKHGHDPLEVFHATLVTFLLEHIGAFLGTHGLYCRGLAEIIEGRIMHRDFFELSSGLKVSIQHPYMARAKTTSIRPQEMMDFARRHGCQVAIGGNFHVSELVAEWDMTLGQCVCIELGTIKHGSNFERSKMKMVDQGVGYLKIVSNDKRIEMVENAFYGSPRLVPPVDNVSIINWFLEKFSVSPIKMA
ncbi:MAG: hypothetical protein AAB362_00645 [Patescibacteria group bacterium]